MNPRLKFLRRSRENDVDPVEILDIGWRLIEKGRATDDEWLEENGHDLVRLAICLQEDIVFRDRPVTGWMGTSIACVLITVLLGAVSIWFTDGYSLAISLVLLGLIAATVPFAQAQSLVSSNLNASVRELWRIKDNAFPEVVIRPRGRQATDSATGSKPAPKLENSKLAMHALGKAFSKVGKSGHIPEWEKIGADLIAKAKMDPLAGTVAHVGEASGGSKTPPRTDGGT